VNLHPEFQAIKGWLVSGGYVLDAHSVVCDAAGALWDITFPDLADQRTLFIRHQGTDDEFTSLRKDHPQHIFIPASDDTIRTVGTSDIDE
jgi:hypothetical protein